MRTTENLGYVTKGLSGFWKRLTLSIAPLAESKFLSLYPCRT